MANNPSIASYGQPEVDCIAAIPSVTGLTISKQYRDGGLTFIELSLSSVGVTISQVDTNDGAGGLKILDLPVGLIQVVGALASLSVSCSDSDWATAALVASLGSVTAGANETLTSTEADIIASTAVTGTNLVAGAGSFSMVSSAQPIYNGTTTAPDVYVNFASDTDAGATPFTLSVTGTIRLWFKNFGDI